MNQTLSYLIICLFLVLSCNNDEIDRDGYGASDWSITSNQSKRTIENSYSRKDTHKYANIEDLKYRSEVDTNTYIKDYYLENSTKYKFSNNETYDDFMLTIKGRTIHYAVVEFAIYTSKGERIYYDKFPLMKVIERVFDGKGEYATFIQKDDYMRGWVNYFFKNENFLTPAIHAERKFEAEFSNKQNWDAIASNSNSVGFVYSKSKGSQTEIAFDKAQNRVIEYYDY